jgi:hypothetical protein
MKRNSFGKTRYHSVQNQTVGNTSVKFARKR